MSKRIGGAVERNSVKRMLREAYRGCSASLKGETDLVFVARAPLVELIEAGGLSAVSEKMAEVFSKASLSQSRQEGRVTR